MLFSLFFTRPSRSRGTAVNCTTHHAPPIETQCRLKEKPGKHGPVCPRCFGHHVSSSSFFGSFLLVIKASINRQKVFGLLCKPSSSWLWHVFLSRLVV